MGLALKLHVALGGTLKARGVALLQTIGFTPGLVESFWPPDSNSGLTRDHGRHAAPQLSI